MRVCNSRECSGSSFEQLHQMRLRNAEMEKLVR